MPTSSSRAREVAYGHKLNLTTGRSGLILDLVIEAGNPADASAAADARAPHRALWRAAASAGRRRQLRQSRQPEPGQGPRRARHGLPQEARPPDRGHGQEPLGLSQAPELPRRHRGRHLVPQARLRPGPLHLARAQPLQGLRLVRGGRLQSRAGHPAEPARPDTARTRVGRAGPCSSIPTAAAPTTSTDLLA